MSTRDRFCRTIPLKKFFEKSTTMNKRNNYGYITTVYKYLPEKDELNPNYD